MIDETNFICLATIPKSGTHYMHHFVVNYLRRLIGIEERALFGSEAHEAYPNRRYDYINKGKPYEPTGPLPEGVRDIVVQHAFGSLESFPGWIITQARNPLDFIVSQYHYRHQSRVDTSLHVENISAVVGDYALKWARGYVGFTRLIASDRKVLPVKYEELIQQPGDVFRRVVRFIEQPLDDALIDRTIADIAADKFRQVEIELTPNPTLTHPLARNGSIGQWRTEMSEADIEVARRVLKGRRLDLDEIMAGWEQPA